MAWNGFRTTTTSASSHRTASAARDVRMRSKSSHRIQVSDTKSPLRSSDPRVAAHGKHAWGNPIPATGPEHSTPYRARKQ
eukprot:557745-Prymnesium_polylepis.1